MGANEIIVVRQLPVIEEKLKTVKAEVESKINLALSLVCNEDTVKEIKATRSDLNKQFSEFEALRKGIKNQIMEPYSNFELTYKECISDMFKSADATLAKKISEVEDTIKQEKANEIKAYFDEYKASKNVDFVTLSDAGVNITLSASKKSLKGAVKTYIDKVADDLALIDTQEDKEEILVEYKSSLNVSRAITIVKDRKARIAAEKERIEKEKQLKEQKPDTVSEKLSVSLCKKDNDTAPFEPEQPKGTIIFKITHSYDRLIKLKEFLDNGGYSYEQI